MANHTIEVSSLHHYINVLRRRKWIVLQAIVIAPLAAVLFSLHQEHLYRASAEVLINYRDLGSTLTGVPSSSIYVSADRVAKTQADLARVPTVAQRALRSARITDITPSELLEKSSVSPKTNSDLLIFAVSDPIPLRAARLATAYARAFTVYRHELDTLQLQRARRDVEAQLKQLELLGRRKTALYVSLLQKQQLLQTMETLTTPNIVIRSATNATQVQPRPLRNGLLGFAIGLILGLGLAFLRDVLDTRMRSAEEVGERLGLPLLARLPEPPARLRSENKLSILEDPDSVNSEAFRVLRTNFEFVNLERGAKIVMLTSALEAEGKTTTVANLAVALARAGRRVIAIDLDLRRPMLDKMLSIGKRPGVTQVALGQLDLEDALVPVPITERRRGRLSLDIADEWSNGHKEHLSGTLRVVPAGAVPPNVGEFVGSRTLSDLLEDLRADADIVLVDAPPLLRVGDAITLSGKVDAMIVATNLATIRRPILNELRRVLDSCPADKLGFIVTGAHLEEGYGAGYGYGYGSYTYRPTKTKTPV